jgi:hypothetical protein
MFALAHAAACVVLFLTWTEIPQPAAEAAQWVLGLPLILGLRWLSMDVPTLVIAALLNSCFYGAIVGTAFALLRPASSNTPRSLGPPKCQNCGYNLTGARQDRPCPECGAWA